MAKRIGIGLWSVVLCLGIAIFFFAPHALESVVCSPTESLQARDLSGASLKCVDAQGNAHDRTASIVGPFALLMIAVPVLIGMIVVTNRIDLGHQIPDPMDMTWSKRFLALWRAIMLYGDWIDNTVADTRKIKHAANAYWAYFRGNATPLLGLYAEPEHNLYWNGKNADRRKKVRK